ncbi:bifunctional 3-(3-hydroxy-phenyl)propionate/3-hydroxycinnamic acid hydroxylase [Halomonas binhaiensis]|uniref:3-(3-hydroxy-phenyl)propionate/3-hydroxycinnamic acid hydroxylase n=1 Tax=Halomonas binhaiensis TaxID=2562282 RepID=A0A5C1NDU7_9GAMM|nr:bifunctional 3-(3-hydroxy-phenyl)propionate/3-hydroxycinnamic acid hydroxylase [Halomonas binhaiensis]QEM80247.1 bifunctional 3-(3-hydroxy-phenyl)propionate/3-hydroxycinnamic acid hydroxylase [Halomonas binhaiensis]
MKNRTGAPNHEVEIVIVGAGPVGLTLANYLGMRGVKVMVIEKLDQLIDYPRAIGIDDESLRTIQAIGLIDDVLPHTTPYHSMRFLTPKGRCFADIQPMTDEFGWSRRNAFIQPQVDAVLHSGLSRYSDVEVLFSRSVNGIEQDEDGVVVSVENEQKPGETESVRAKYLVACDGGNSYVRRSLDIGFYGKTAPNQWIVVDIAKDPLAIPNVYLCADPVRPYVSAALPHATRRFEFMVMPGETQEQLSQPENMKRLLSSVLPNPDNVELIRSRVYTHNARLAERFRDKRILLAGDAAHIMPVWQGQGYNSGMRDASNLAWKLALVVKGKASPHLLDTYEDERRDHAKAMIDLSVMAGHVLAPPRRWQGTLRDGISWLLNYVPPVKRYFLEMRFKPMPKYERGAQVEVSPKPKGPTPVGKMFIQPRVDTEHGEEMLLDDVIGCNFAFIAWGADPTWGLNEEQVRSWRELGTTFIQVVPSFQLKAPSDVSDGVIRIGDSQGRLKEWFGRFPASIAVLRPDRFVGAVAIPQTIGEVSDRYLSVLGVEAGDAIPSRENINLEVA